MTELTLTENTTLSESSIWDAMKAYYNHMGLEAWQDEEVPQLITSNCFLAQRYAEMIKSLILDYRQANGSLDPDEPFYIVELGAGHGKLAFYILKTLEKELAGFDIPFSQVQYVMTDISEKSLQGWQEHHALKPYFEKGVLDAALYDATSDNTLTLTKKKKTIKQGALNKPMVLVCNYLFDSLPHDAFQIKDETLYETLITLKREDKEQERNERNFFEDLTYQFIHSEAKSDYYQDPQLNLILGYYLKTFQKASFLIPIGGFHCIEHAGQLSKAGYLLLIGDKGDIQPSQFEHLDEPFIPFHGSVSLNVNFHALDHYYQLSGGISLVDNSNFGDFHVACFGKGISFNHPHLNNTFNHSLRCFNPNVFSTVCLENPDKIHEVDDLEIITGILQLSQWDPNVFYDYSDFIVDEISDADEALQQTYLYASELMKENFFLLEKHDVLFEIGRLLYEIDEIERSIEFYELSVEHFGRQPEVLYNLILCQATLESPQENLLRVKTFLEEFPHFTLAKDYKRGLIKELKLRMS